MRNLSGGGLAVTRGHCSQAPLSPSNFARNSSVACSNIEFISLELQCFREVTKNDRGKLCATFAGVVIAVTLDPLPVAGAVVMPRRDGAISHAIPLSVFQVLKSNR